MPGTNGKVWLKSPKAGQGRAGCSLWGKMGRPLVCQVREVFSTWKLTLSITWALFKIWTETASMGPAMCIYTLSWVFSWTKHSINTHGFPPLVVFNYWRKPQIIFPVLLAWLLWGCMVLTSLGHHGDGQVNLQLHRRWGSGQGQTSLGRHCADTRKSCGSVAVPSVAVAPKCHRSYSVNQVSPLKGQCHSPGRHVWVEQ